MKRSLPVVSIVGAAVLALSILVVGCGSGSTADDSKALEGKTWKATEIAGVKSVLSTKGSAATAKFTAGKVTGSGTINRYTAPYTTGPGNTIEIGAAREHPDGRSLRTRWLRSRPTWRRCRKRRPTKSPTPL